MMLFLNTLKFATLLHPSFSGCVLIGASPTIYVAWILLMVYDTGMLVMMLIPGVDACRRGGRSELATTIYRDGVMHYMFLCLFSLIHVIFISTLPDDLIFLLTIFERVLHSALASRAILHIRQVVRRNVFDTMSDIDTQIHERFGRS
ncbi:hypothetical protein L218DRAFT_731204 [Marasmius fiardii PR-910]|nr:hypothetical protein L218DRAFT_731204 [Marasmius fiardii PR-910]